MASKTELKSVVGKLGNFQKESKLEDDGGGEEDDDDEQTNVVNSSSPVQEFGFSSIQNYEEIVGTDSQLKADDDEDTVTCEGENPLEQASEDVIVTEIVNEDDENVIISQLDVNLLSLRREIPSLIGPSPAQHSTPTDSHLADPHEEQLPIIKTYIKPTENSNKKPVLKIVPPKVEQPEKVHKIVMKIQHKENTPELEVNSSEKEPLESLKLAEEIKEEPDDTISIVDYDEDSSPQVHKTKIRREVKQLQKMMDSSKVLTDFMNDPTNNIRKSRKVGRPPQKSKQTEKTSPSSMDLDKDSPNNSKRQNMRSSNAEFSQKQRKFLKNIQSVEAMDLEEADVEPFEEELSDNTDNETNESVASVESKRPVKNISSHYVISKPPKDDNDPFCWRCHVDSVAICCNFCVRSYHTKCLKLVQVADNLDSWKCPECVNNVESADLSKEISKTGEKLSNLFMFAWKRITQLKRSTEAINTFNGEHFEDFDKMIKHPVTLQVIEENILADKYKSTEAFTADFKWILHNCYVYFSHYSPINELNIVKIAKSLLKTCKQEMNQIETCAECYNNANTKKDWFIEVCERPHILLWAKLKGFPYWPAKGMAVNSAALVDVRFFGAHDRAWVPVRDCYLYSEKNPNVYKIKKNKIVQCIKEIEVHIAKIKDRFGSFNYPEFRTQYDPNAEIEQLKIMIPTFGQATTKENLTLNIQRSSSPTAIVSVPTNSQITKANLTYKIIKTADNNLLISPVVKTDKPDFSVTSTNSIKSKDEDLEKQQKKKHHSNSSTSPVSSTTNQNSSSTPETTPSVQKEALKPTKIVIKNSYDHNNQKQYQLVNSNENVEENRKVESMIIKRKSDNWNVNSNPKKSKANLDTVSTEPPETIKRKSSEEIESTPEPKIRLKRTSKNKSQESKASEVETTESEVEEKPKDIIPEIPEPTVEQNKIMAVKEALVALPQISIVPSRKNSGTKEEKKSEESGGAIEIRRVTRSESRTKEIVEIAKEKEEIVPIVPNLVIKSEPISDDEQPNTMVSDPVHKESISRTNSLPNEESKLESPEKQKTKTVPRARKTFARSLNIRPKPVFNPRMSSSSNMVCIPVDNNSRPDLVEATLARDERIEERISNNSSPNHMLSNAITPGLAAAVTEIISKTGPPKLVQKPTSTLQSTGDLIFPSEAGSSCRILMENAHKITDFFRSVIEDTIADMADKGCLEAKVKLLQLEIEKLKYSHKKEITELKQNTDLILCEMKNSMEQERSWAINETRRQCEVERLQAIEDTKRKQWCANCGKEAQFYCCWNTSYCDYPCQQQHWNIHMSSCSQAESVSKTSTPTPSRRTSKTYSKQKDMSIAHNSCTGVVQKNFSLANGNTTISKNLTILKNIPINQNQMSPLNTGGSYSVGKNWEIQPPATSPSFILTTNPSPIVTPIVTNLYNLANKTNVVIPGGAMIYNGISGVAASSPVASTSGVSILKRQQANGPGFSNGIAVPIMPIHSANLSNNSSSININSNSMEKAISAPFAGTNSDLRPIKNPSLSVSKSAN